MKTTFAQTSEGVTQSPLDNSTKLATTAYADNAITTLAAYAGGYIQSDGVTANRAAGIYGPFDAVNNVRGWVAGAASLTLWIKMQVPTSNPIGTADISSFSLDTGPNFRGPNSLSVFIETTGELQICQGTTSYVSNSRRFNYSGFRAAYSGQTGIMEVVFTNGTSDPAVRWNGVNISSLFSLAINGTAPDWLAASMVPNYNLVGVSWPAGVAPEVTPFLGSLTDAERAFWLSTGKPPAWVVAGGSPSERVANGGFETAGGGGADVFASWSEVVDGSGTLSRDTVDFDTGVASLKFTTDGAGTGGRVEQDIGMVVGNRYLFTLRAKSDINGALMDIRGSGLVQAGVPYIALTTSWASYSVEAVWAVSNSSVALVRNGATQTSRSFWVDSFSVKQLGALTLPSVQPINVLDDVSGIGGNQGRTLGMKAVTSRTDWTIRQDVVHAGADNKRILEGALINTTRDVIDSIEQTPSTGTPTTLVGSASAGAQYKASSALAAGINPVTLVTRKTATTEFWSQASTACLLRTTITGHRAN